ncbi:GDP-mannose transporter into the lumen of the Golgi [Clydaea vesicula]|uniref:GDP-mannose transporter n=1 Tax=Clydaea vesicula TaxID=447962 RepID=A0AAD5TZG9_9FUNG|nr:GDP-mannose transporter into the lumen of the Golgi [Clydaea vesicula]KAJ3381921.1 GDP-mannose transporter into the lumen of the Golgi [Lobulomyces angularis]
MPAQKGQGSVLAIISYCLSSILMTVINKFVLSGLDLKLVCLLLVAQNLTCVVILEIFSKLGVLSHRPFKSQEAKKWFVVSLVLVLMIYTGSKALKYLSIPLFTVFKNLTIIIIAFGEKTYFGGSKVTGSMMLSFLMMVASAVIAGWSDISSSGGLKQEAKEVGLMIPYIWMAANCFSTAFNSLVMRKKIRQFNFTDFDTVYYNNLIGVPILLVVSFFTEYSLYAPFYNKYFVENPEELFGLIVAVTFSGIFSFGISYCTGWCLRVTSSTTYSMAGALNKLPISILGMVLFDADVTLGGVLGVLLAFFAGVIYSYAKNLQAQQNITQPLPLHTYEKVNKSGDNLYDRTNIRDNSTILFEAENLFKKESADDIKI